VSTQKLFLGLVTVLLLSNFAASPAVSQRNQSNQTPDQKPRKIRPEPKKVYQDWPKKEVSLIITPEEQKAYDKLATDEEREQFIQTFWRQRDPDPDTEENEYKDGYYERLSYANEHFTSGKPGWMTDRGKIFIKFGKPDEIESHPAGGQYERMSYEGGGTTTTYPFERWFYRYIQGVRSGAEIEFVDPSGTGEYRMARNPDEKDAMLHVPGAGPTLGEILGVETRADRIAGVGGLRRSNYLREQDSPFAMAEFIRDLEKAPEFKRGYFAGTLTSSPRVDDYPLSFDIRADYFRQSDNRVLTAFTIQTDNKELSFHNSGGLQTARLNIFGRITTVADRHVGVFEDSVTTSATQAELTGTKEGKSAYAKAFILEPGRYRVDVLVRDEFSGAAGIKHYGFQVPNYEPHGLAASSIVLAAKLESMAGLPAGGPFVIGQTKVVPNLTGVYHRGQPVGVYMQVYNVGIDQTTLRPSVDVEYALLKDGQELSTQAEDWSGLSDSGQRLTLARLIDSRALAPGEYELVIRIRDRVTGQRLSPSAKFTITQ
jgi:GWxTD domain-containing protein